MASNSDPESFAVCFVSLFGWESLLRRVCICVCGRSVCECEFFEKVKVSTAGAVVYDRICLCICVRASPGESASHYICSYAWCMAGKTSAWTF